jgi:CHAD domain-containing protein
MNVKVQRRAKNAERNTPAFPPPASDKESRTPAQATRPATVAMPVIKPKYPAAELIRSALKGAIGRMQAADPEARRGEPEGVHRLRTSTRRLRSELRTVSDLVDREWGEHLEQELKWLAGELGSVRDLDILCQRLHSAAPPRADNGRVSASPCDPGQDDTLAPLVLVLRERHSRNSRALRDALQGERYRDLLARMAAAIEGPTFKDDAWEPCRKALPPLAAAAWLKLKKGGRDLEAASPDADFHQVRKLAKRARYASELIAPALGSRTVKHARRFIRLTTQLQDILGEHQDAIVAATELQRFLARNPHDQKLAHRVHDLLETQHQASQASRARFFDVWKKLDRKKSLRWFKLKKKAGASAS